MATQQFTVDTAKYTLVSETDCIVQNLSPYPIKVVFSETHPLPDTPNFRLVHPPNTKKGTQEHTITKFLNIPEGNVYVMCGGPAVSNRTSEISVTTGQSTLGDENKNIECILKDILKELRLLRIITEETFQTTIDENDIGINSHED